MFVESWLVMRRSIAVLLVALCLVTSTASAGQKPPAHGPERDQQYQSAAKHYLDRVEEAARGKG